MNWESEQLNMVHEFKIKYMCIKLNCTLNQHRHFLQ